jgi:hypothetical protein
MGPNGGIQVGATWSNTTTSAVPPLLVDATNVGGQGVQWNFQYCTTGDSSANCVQHIQMVGQSGICHNFQMGDPQHGQTPGGKFSNAVQTGYWVGQPQSRVGPTFDFDVSFTARLAATGSKLWWGPLSLAEPAFEVVGECNVFYCDCVNHTEESPVSANFTFQIDFPSTLCQ